MNQFLVALVAVILVFAALRAHADETWDLTLEAGDQFDSNVHRTTGDGVPADGARTAARLDLADKPTAKTLLKLDAIGAAEAFAGSDPSTEDIGVVAGDVRFVGFAGTFAPGFRASYYDAYQRRDEPTADEVDLHDFRTGDAAATLTLLAGADRLTASAGYRFFTYKPDATFDFAGEVFGLAWSRRFAGDADGPTWDVAAAYSIDRRRYDSHAIASLCPPGTDVQTTCLIDAGMQRADLFHDAAIDLTYTGKRIFDARYTLQINDSNSFGQSLVRHRLDLAATSETFADIYVTVKLVLQLDRYSDGLLLGGDIGTFTTIEDETRNSIVIHATRELSKTWTAEARYAYYTNPFADDSTSYSRHTFYVGAVYTFQSTR